MPPLESSHMRFLSEAAEWFQSSSPSTSAHLLNAHTRNLHEELKPLSIHQKKHHCTCGTMRHSNSTRVTRVQSKKSGKLQTNSGTAVVYKCLPCKQRTVLPRKKSLRTSKPSYTLPVHTTESLSAPTTTAPSPAPSTPAETSAPESSSANSILKTADNASSKKRAKSRKQGGLQALLASKQKSQASLDLFDFLQ